MIQGFDSFLEASTKPGSDTCCAGHLGIVSCITLTQQGERNVRCCGIGSDSCGPIGGTGTLAMAGPPFVIKSRDKLLSWTG